MILLTQLQATAAAGELREPRGILTAVHAEPVRGVHVTVMLGGHGLFIRRGDAVVAIPLGELLALAAEKEPALLDVAPTPKPITDH